MILSYKDHQTRLFAEGHPVRRFRAFEKQAEKRLSVLHAAASLEVLRNVRSNRLKKLGGDRTGQYAIRINRQWRICFEWPAGQGGPSNVEIVDYHS